MYIHELNQWPNFCWNEAALVALLQELEELQTTLGGELSKLGFEARDEASLRTLTQDVVKTSEIEGEILNPAQVRSSLALRLGLNNAGLPHSDQNVDGIVEVLLDATKNYGAAVTETRLFGWHSNLFPTGFSGIQRIKVGGWRNDSNGPMQVVSGPYGNRLFISKHQVIYACRMKCSNS